MVPDRFWLAGIGVLSPLLGVAVTLITMRMSARSVDPGHGTGGGARGGTWFLVIFGLFGKVPIASFSALVAAIGMAIVLDLWLFRRVEKTFEREEIRPGGSAQSTEHRAQSTSTGGEQ
jgi:hypothetical protein